MRQKQKNTSAWIKSKIYRDVFLALLENPDIARISSAFALPESHTSRIAAETGLGFDVATFIVPPVERFKHILTRLEYRQPSRIITAAIGGIDKRTVLLAAELCGMKVRPLSPYKILTLIEALRVDPNASHAAKKCGSNPSTAAQIAHAANIQLPYKSIGRPPIPEDARANIIATHAVNHDIGQTARATTQHRSTVARVLRAAGIEMGKANEKPAPRLGRMKATTALRATVSAIPRPARPW